MLLYWLVSIRRLGITYATATPIFKITISVRMWRHICTHFQIRLQLVSTRFQPHHHLKRRPSERLLKNYGVIYRYAPKLSCCSTERRAWWRFNGNNNYYVMVKTGFRCITFRKFYIPQGLLNASRQDQTSTVTWWVVLFLVNIEHEHCISHAEYRQQRLPQWRALAVTLLQYFPPKYSFVCQWRCVLLAISYEHRKSRRHRPTTEFCHLW